MEQINTSKENFYIYIEEEDLSSSTDLTIDEDSKPNIEAVPRCLTIRNSHQSDILESTLESSLELQIEEVKAELRHLPIKIQTKISERWKSLALYLDKEWVSWKEPFKYYYLMLRSDEYTEYILPHIVVESEITDICCNFEGTPYSYNTRMMIVTEHEDLPKLIGTFKRYCKMKVIKPLFSTRCSFRFNKVKSRAQWLYCIIYLQTKECKCIFYPEATFKHYNHARTDFVLSTQNERESFLNFYKIHNPQFMIETVTDLHMHFFE